jgi:hypothetical protein
MHVEPLSADDREMKTLDVRRPMYTLRPYAHTIQSMLIPRKSARVFARTCKPERLFVRLQCVDTCQVFRETQKVAS